MSSVSEPFGLTALEAAHHDNAVILTKQSGVGEVLNSVFRYDFWDEDVLADQLIGIATSFVLKKSMQDDVKKEYARISWHDAAWKLMRIYNDMQRMAIS
jgi:glycosyltransferase involved in cell wall biosynthesis